MMRTGFCFLKGSKKAQSGLSLIELMISLVLGLVLVLGLIQVFLASRQTFATNDAMSKTQENGRFALEFIARSARQAAYLTPGSPLDRPNPVMGISCGKGSGATGSGTTNPCSDNRTTTEGDVVSFSFEPPVIDGNRRDCVGKVVAANNVIVNTFFIQPATASNPSPSFACKSFNLTTNTAESPTQRLIDGIEALQVQYGIDQGGQSTSANLFVSADRVTSWSKVLSVRIAVLASSIDPVIPAPTQRNFYLLDAPPVAPNDGLTRQIFTTTVNFKNIY